MLNQTQKRQLNSFINHFLPVRGNKRAHSGNEITYIRRILNQIFYKYFNYKISKEDILDAFDELGYTIFTKNAAWDEDDKAYKPSTSTEITRGGDLYKKYSAAYIYVDIDASLLRKLALIVFKERPNTQELKKELSVEMKNKMTVFIESLTKE